MQKRRMSLHQLAVAVTAEIRQKCSDSVVVVAAAAVVVVVVVVMQMVQPLCHNRVWSALFLFWNNRAREQLLCFGPQSGFH